MAEDTEGYEMYRKSVEYAEEYMENDDGLCSRIIRGVSATDASTPA